MSLLMDALKKAELAKREGRSENRLDADANNEATENSSASLTLEPLSAPATGIASRTGTTAQDKQSPDHLSHLSSHLESLDDAFLAEMQTAVRRTPPGSVGATSAAPRPRTQPAIVQPVQPAFKTEPATAQNLFTAKQPAPAVRNKNFALLLGGLTALAVIAIGIYFWWQLQPHAPPPATILPHEVPLAASSPLSPVAVLPAPSFPGSAPLAASATATNENDGDSLIAKPKNSLRAPRQSSQNSRHSKGDAIGVENATDASDPVHLTKFPPQVNPSVMRGFDAFNRGDLASAHAEYTRALQSDPRNTDALHGLAAIAQKQGHWDQAARGYQKILEANPQDAVALAELINIRGQADPATAESRLKALVAAQPELAAPAFSLGNLYARQGRWNEAQQAYFQAYSAEPNNPDILYNLAISLEHIRQSKLAAQYYGQAIAAAKIHPANFDSVQAAARLQALQP
ncbi:MAG TPA: tetratricopeptide repeat protein [Rugosibacter sp.]